MQRYPYRPYSQYGQYQDVLNNSIFVAGIVLIVFEAVILIIYFVLGPAILSVLNGIFNLNNAPAEMATYSPEILLIFDAIFAVAFITPVIWFFVVLFRKEHGYQFRRY